MNPTLQNKQHEQINYLPLFNLPENVKQELIDYYMFLKQKYLPLSTKETELALKKRVLGGMEKVIISDDFNDPIDDLKEYM